MAIEATRRAAGDAAADALARLVTTRLASQLLPQNRLSRLSDRDFACLVVSAGRTLNLRTAVAMLSQALEEPMALPSAHAQQQPVGETALAPVVIKSCEALLWASGHSATPRVPGGLAAQPSS